MWYFNLVFNRLFDLLLIPFRFINPFWSLFAVSILTGIVMLVIFKYTSNQQEIREIKNKIKAHLLEIRLFKDNIGILLSAQKKIFFYNIKYMKYALKPMLFLIVPVTIIVIQLDGWFGYKPLELGGDTIVSATVSEKAAEALPDVTLEVDKGLVIETPPIRIPETREVSWRIRAKEVGKHHLLFNVSGHTFQKIVVVTDGRLTRVSPRVVASNIWKTLLYPGEEPLEQDSQLEQIDVAYAYRTIGIFGLHIHWIAVFFILSIASGYGFKRFFRVEI